MSKTIGTVEINGFTCEVDLREYANNNRKGLSLYVKESGEPYCTATMNMPEIPLNDDEVIIKNYDNNTGVLEALVGAGIIEDLQKTVPLGFVDVHICRLIAA